MEDRPDASDELPELRFGPLRSSPADVIAAFTDERELIQQLADEIAEAHGEPVDLPAAERTYTELVRAGATAQMLSAVTSAEESARSVFAHERILLDEARARAVVLQFARGRKYTSAKELVAAAAAFVKAQEIRRLVADPNHDPTLLALGLSFATWVTAAGLHREFEVARDPRRATQVRSDEKNRRVERLRAAIDRGEVKPVVAAIMAWRKQAPTRANREKARLDLKAAQPLRKNDP
jgi:hypothetical protein